MSHNVLARTTRSGEETVVEAITKVQSIDLVADPATTSGLYEHVKGHELRVDSEDLETDDPAATLESITLEKLRVERPDLVCEIENACATQLLDVKARLEELTIRDEATRRRECIFKLLQEHNLPLPTSNRSVDSQLIGPQFIESLMQAADDQVVRQLIEERAELVRAACNWNGSRHATDRRPRSRQQLEFSSIANTRPLRSGAEFAAAVRGR
jgi:hypothetical protein